MGLRSLLFPWYRWNDRWAWHVEPLSDGSGTNPIIFTCPPSVRFDILSIIGIAEAHPLGAGFKVLITARRGQHIFAVNHSGLGAAPGQTNLVAYQRMGLGNTRDTANFSLGWYLPENFILLPGDTLMIEASGGVANSHLHDWTFAAKRWED